MSRQRRFLGLLGLVILATMLLATPVVARSTKTTFSTTWSECTVVGPGTTWPTGNGGLQMRGSEMYFQVPDPAVPVPALHDPRLEGEWHMFFDCHFDANLAGPWNGTFYVDLVFEGEPGGWTGTFQGVCFGGAGALGGDAYLNAKGYGCFEGLKFKAYMLNPGDGGVRPIDGYIHDPQGE